MSTASGFGCRHVVVVAKVITIVLGPTLPHHAVIADQRRRPMLHHMAHGTTKRLKKCLNTSSSCFTVLMKTKIRMKSTWLDSKDTLLQHQQYETSTPIEREATRLISCNRRGRQHRGCNPSGWSRGRLVPKRSPFRRPEQVSNGISQLRGRKIHQQTVVTIADYFPTGAVAEPTTGQAQLMASNKLN